MKLSECFYETEKEQVYEIAKNLGLERQIKLDGIPVSIRWLFDKHIEKILLNFDRLEAVVLRNISKETLIYLKQRIFCGRAFPNNNNSRQELTRFGIIFKDQIPEDLEHILKINLLPRIVKQFYQEPISISAFVKLILLLRLIQKERIPFNTEKKNKEKSLIKISKKLLLDGTDRVMGYLLDFMIHKGLIQISLNTIEPDKKAISNWYSKSSFNNIREFYEWIILNFSASEVLTLVRKLGEVQQNPKDWVDADIFTGIASFKPIKEHVNLFGLIRFTEYEGTTYLQLTNEGWFFSNESNSPNWNEPNIVISADGELFIPHWCNPYVIMIIDWYCQLRDNDYFLIYELPEQIENSKGIFTKEMLIDTIMNNSLRIPNIVEHDLMKMSGKFLS